MDAETKPRPTRTGPKTAANQDDNAQPADAMARIASLMEMFAGPLQLYLEAQTESYSVGNPSEVPIDRVLGDSPIAPLLADESVSDILINGPGEIFVTRNSKLEKTDITFSSPQRLSALARAIAASCGRVIDPRRPLVDARLRDGSRVNIIAPPMAVDGLTLSIRKFPKQEITLEALVKKGEMSEQAAEFLKLCAQSRVSLLISGGTGTGKTTLLNAISAFIPADERIITIEDTAELRLQQPHVVRLETKEPTVIDERREEVNTSDLVKNTLRMRPDRIIVGEVRGIEAFDMIQALNTGHDGSMTTVHANTPRDAFTRIENLMGPRVQNTPSEGVRKQIASALNFIVQLVYGTDGTRRISSIVEVVGMEKDVPTMQAIFKLGEDSVSDPSKVQVRQIWTGIIPRHTRLSEALRASPLFAPALDAMAKAQV